MTARFTSEQHLKDNPTFIELDFKTFQKMFKRFGVKSVKNLHVVWPGNVLKLTFVMFFY